MRARRRQAGTVFVVTLAILAGLVAVLAAAAATQRAKFSAVLNRTEGRQARLAAEAGLQRALAELSLLTAGQAATQNDNWYGLGRRGEERFRLGSLSFRIQIVDAGSRVNLNSAPEDQLNRMPFTQEQIDSLLDWRETGNAPRAQGGKDEYYNNLPNPYNAGLRRLDTFDSLLLVRGFTPQSLYSQQENVVSTATLTTGPSDQQPTLFDLSSMDSFSPQTTPDGQTRINVNAANVTAQQLQQRQIPTDIAAQIVQRRPFARFGDVIALAGANRQAQRAMLDNLTISAATRTNGLINLNTATEAVLNTIPNLPPDVVQSILSRQEQGFAQLSDILDVPGMTGTTLTNSIDRFTVQSSLFMVRVQGESGGSRASIQAWVAIENNVPRVLRIETPPFGDMPTRWGWPEETTVETDLGEGQTQ